MITRAWTFVIDAEDGSVTGLYQEGHIRFVIEFDAEEFSSFAGMINGALGDSKMAAS